MKLRYLSLGAVAFGFVIGGSAAQANADIPGESGCKGSALWLESGVLIAAETDGGVYTIPRKDTVGWEGSVASPPGVYSGSVGVDLPWPLDKVEIDSWSGDSQTTSNSGVHEYEFPTYVPAGVEFKVSGEHLDENGGCSGSITLKIAGGTSKAGLVALAGTVVFTILTILGLKPLFITKVI